MKRNSRGNREIVPAIFFDLGNTLLYYQGDRVAIELDAYEVVANYLIAKGLKIPLNGFLKRFQEAMQSYYHRRETTLIEETTIQQLKTVLRDFGYDNLPPVLLRKALDQMYLVTEPPWQLDPDTHPCLSKLQSSECQLGLISNASDAPNAFRLLRKHNLYQYFSIILISSVVGYRKPHPIIFETALTTCRNIGKEDIYMAGDLLSTDVIGGKNIGMRTIWLSKYAIPPDDQESDAEIQPDLILPNLSSLCNWMEQQYLI
jgi:FMN phosphatase YigB (HAD superfamily)